MDDYKYLLNYDLILRDFVTAILDIKIRTIKGDRMGIHERHDVYEARAVEWINTYFNDYSDISPDEFIAEYDKRIRQRKKEGKKRLERS